MLASFLNTLPARLIPWLRRANASTASRDKASAAARDAARQVFETDILALLDALTNADAPAVGFAGAAVDIEAATLRSPGLEAARAACLLILRGPGPMPDLMALETSPDQNERYAARLARQAQRMMIDPAARLTVEDCALGAVADSLNYLASTHAYQSQASAREASQIAQASTMTQAQGAARL